MKAHVLGNGPSINLYEPQDDYVVGCNFQQFPVDVSVILDVRPWHIYMKDRSIIQGKPVITSQYAMDGMKHKNIEAELDIVYKLPYLEQYMSSAHVAVQWCIEHDYSEIHLWGCDSIWADTVETRTDTIIERARIQQDLHIHWREKWKAFISYNIIVHNTKEGTQLRDLL